MSTPSKPTNKHYFSATTVIDTGAFDGCCWTTNRSGSRRFIFKESGVARQNPVFAITDAEFNVIKWIGPHAAEAAEKRTA